MTHLKLTCLLLMPTWAQTQKDLPSPHGTLLEDTLGFLDCLTKWITQHNDSRSKQDGLAFEAMQDTPEIWPGFGVYTAVEAFFLAGRSKSRCFGTFTLINSRYRYFPHRGGGV
jgi:hypothetical protein